MRGRGYVGSGVVLLFSLGTSAQSAAPFEPSPRPARSSRGPVVGLRTGFAIPMGKVSGAPDDDMTDLFTGQVPLQGELGWRPIPQLFVGGYLGGAVGGVADAIKDICDANNTSCFAIGARLGLELQYHSLPEWLADPWLGYGIGLEVATLSQRTWDDKQTVTLTGFEYAHLMGGVDFRVSKRFTLGPVVDFALGRYLRYSEEINYQTTADRGITDQADHQWLMLGVRGSFYP